jgi:hypothetical protein
LEVVDMCKEWSNPLLKRIDLFPRIIVKSRISCALPLFLNSLIQFFFLENSKFSKTLENL